MPTTKDYVVRVIALTIASLVLTQCSSTPEGDRQPSVPTGGEGGTPPLRGSRGGVTGQNMPMVTGGGGQGGATVMAGGKGGGSPDPGVGRDGGGDAPGVDTVPRAGTPDAGSNDGGQKSSGALEMVFNQNVLHEITIKVEAQYLDRLDKVRHADVPAKFSFDGQTFDQVTITKKGAYGFLTPLTDKPSFSLNINGINMKARLHGLDSLTLDSGRQDKGFLNEPLGYEIYRRMGVAASLTSHAYVTFNDKPYGIYVVKESEDSDFVARNWGAENKGGNLYEAPCNPPDPGKPDPGCVDFVTRPERMELKKEKEEMRKRDDLVALAKAINAVPVDANWVAAVSAKLDLEGMILGMAVDALVNHWDGYARIANNYKMYHRPKDDKFVFIPHGMDSLFEVEALPGVGEKINPDTLVASSSGKLAKLVMSTPMLEKKYRDYVQAVLTKAWDVSGLGALIDAQVATIKTTKRMDERTLRDLKRVNEAVPAIKTFLAARKTKYLKVTSVSTPAQQGR